MLATDLLAILDRLDRYFNLFVKSYYKNVLDCDNKIKV